MGNWNFAFKGMGNKPGWRKGDGKHRMPDWNKRCLWWGSLDQYKLDQSRGDYDWDANQPTAAADSSTDLQQQAQDTVQQVDEMAEGQTDRLARETIAAFDAAVGDGSESNEEA